VIPRADLGVGTGVLEIHKSPLAAASRIKDEDKKDTRSIRTKLVFLMASYLPLFKLELKSLF
jgi:hypothetical protein